MTPAASEEILARTPQFLRQFQVQIALRLQDYYVPQDVVSDRGSPPPTW